MRSRIEDIETFFKRPDYELSFRPWLRSLLEDVLVIDAPTLYADRDRFGSLVRLEVIDGATIKKVIDDRGRTPRPIRWTGAPFMWNGMQINRDNYAALGFKVYGELIYAPSYQQILKGLPAVDYTTRDIYQRVLNPRPHKIYGASPVQFVMTTVNIAMRRQFSQFQYYQEGNEPSALYTLPASWTPDQVERWQNYWDNLLAGDLGRRRQMKFIAGDGKSAYVPLKEPPLKSEFDEWLCRVIAFAFSYPATAFVHQVNRATAEQHEAQAEKEGLEPLKQWFQDLANEVIEREFNSADLEFSWAEEDAIDPVKQAEMLCSYVDRGILSVDEARERLGEEPIGKNANAAATGEQKQTMKGELK
jgi:hypothetical protein